MQPGSKLTSGPAEGVKPAEAPTPDLPARCFYRVLEIRRDAAFEDIRKVFRRLAMTTHPDRGGNVRDFQIINEASYIFILYNFNFVSPLRQYATAGCLSEKSAG